MKYVYYFPFIWKAAGGETINQSDWGLSSGLLTLEEPVSREETLGRITAYFATQVSPKNPPGILLLPWILLRIEPDN